MTWEAQVRKSGRTGRSLDIRSGSDPEEFQNVVEKIAELFGFNPRRLKQFINVFRLRVMVALSTGVLTPAQEIVGGASSGGITIQQLGLFTAILMRWSRLAGDLAEEPTLFDQLVVGSISTSDRSWRKMGSRRRVAKGNSSRPNLHSVPHRFEAVVDDYARCLLRYAGQASSKAGENPAHRRIIGTNKLGNLRKHLTQQHDAEFGERFEIGGWALNITNRANRANRANIYDISFDGVTVEAITEFLTGPNSYCINS